MNKFWKVRSCSFCYIHWYKTRLVSSKIKPDVSICIDCLKNCKKLLEKV